MQVDFEPIYRRALARLQKLFAPYKLVPYNLLAAPVDRDRHGGGQFRVGLTVAQNSPLVVAHDLNRVPVGCRVEDNGTVAQTRLTVSARSNTSLTVTPLDAALSAASVLFIF